MLVTDRLKLSKNQQYATKELHTFTAEKFLRFTLSHLNLYNLGISSGLEKKELKVKKIL